MLPSGSRSRASRHIHGWLRGPCSNGDPAPRQLLDALVEIVAFEIDGGRRDDLFLGIDLDRERRAAGGFEPRIVGRIVDDLLEAEPAVEIDRPLVIGAGHRHLVEPRPGADIEPHVLLADRARALAQPRRLVQRHANELARPRHGVGQASSPRRERKRSRWPACSRCHACWWCRSAGPASWSYCLLRSARRRARRLPRARP